MPEIASWIAGYLALGAVVGVFAGMLGIGGGMLVVPPLAMMLEAQGLPREHVLHLAVGTAMATILFTSISSVRAHAARGGVRWQIAWRITPGILFGGIVGAVVANYLSTRTLAIYFTAFVFLAALNMALDMKPKPSRQPPGATGMFAAGTAIGGLSSLVAIGGAVMSVPFMLYCNVPIIQAVGTAAAIGFPDRRRRHDRVPLYRLERHRTARLEHRLRVSAGAGRHHDRERTDRAARRAVRAPRARTAAEAHLRRADVRARRADAVQPVVTRDA